MGKMHKSGRHTHTHREREREGEGLMGDTHGQSQMCQNTVRVRPRPSISFSTALYSRTRL